jgi:tetratricopeptide (TPR) repeat protein
MRTRKASRLAALLMLALPALSYGYEFVPTESEWLSWPSYCRAKYVTTPIGQATAFVRQINGGDIESAQRMLGDEVFLHVHHYCSGAALVGRAKQQPNAQQKKFLYSTALSDLNYVAERIPHSSPVIAKVNFSLAEAYNGLGDRTTALDLLKESVETNPENPASHIALGLFLRANKDLPGARNAFEHGIEAVGEDASAELNYDLALVLLELKENERAAKFARKAYELGYPLPGLRNKLIRMGLWETGADVTHK